MMRARAVFKYIPANFGEIIHNDLSICFLVFKIA